MKRLLQIYLFVVLATTILLALLKLASFPGITWGWVALPILGPFTLWLLFIGLVTTVGLVWPPKQIDLGPCPRVPLNLRYEGFRVELLRVEKVLPYDPTENYPPHALDAARFAQREQYYRKALALELATLAHDTPGFIEWEKRGETLTGELKILVKNEHA
jgi:hypothetical protein